MFMLYKNKISKKTNNEKYVICEINTPINFLGQKIGKDYIECIYEKVDASNNVFFGYDFVREKDIAKCKKFKSKHCAENFARKIVRDCELYDTACKNIKVIPFSDIGKKITF